MKLYYDDIVIKNNRLLNAGYIELSNGINVIIGKNGSGKTLSMKNCFLNQQNIEYSKVFIDQNNDNILDNKSVLENIILSNDNSKKQFVINKLNEYGFSYLLDHPIKTLSGGEKRLINLFRGLLSGEDIIFIDEPTNDLDNETVNKIIDIFKELSKEKIFIIISHDDRILSISNKIFKIDNAELKDSSIIENNYLNNTKKTISKDYNYLKRIFKVNLISIIIAVVICIITGIETYNFSIKEKNIDNKPILDDNEIILFHEFTITNHNLLEKSFPLFCMDLLYETNVFKQVKGLEKMNEFLYDNYEIKFNLNLVDNELFDVYPFEYYSVTDKKYYYTINNFIDNNYPNQKVNIDSSELFSLPKSFEKDDADITVKITKEQFIESSNELKKIEVNGKKLEITCVILILKDGKTLEDFLKSNIYKELLDNEENLIQNNEIYYTINSIRELKNTFIMVKNICIFGLLNVIIDVSLLYVLLRMKKKNFFIIRDYNYHLEDAKEIIRLSINNRYPKLMIILLFIIYNIITFKNNYFIISEYLPSILIALLFSLDFKISNIVINIFIKSMFNWRAR